MPPGALPPTMTSLFTDLRALRLCVELGFLRAQRIAKWAEEVVASDECCDWAYCELALAARKSDAEILDILGEYRDAATDRGTWETVLRWVSEQLRVGELDEGHVIRRIWALAMTTQPSDELYVAFSILEDELSCARDGVFGSLPQVRDHLMEVLGQLGQPGALRAADERRRRRGRQGGF